MADDLELSDDLVEQEYTTELYCKCGSLMHYMAYEEHGQYKLYWECTRIKDMDMKNAESRDAKEHTKKLMPEGARVVQRHTIDADTAEDGAEKGTN